MTRIPSMNERTHTRARTRTHLQIVSISTGQGSMLGTLRDDVDSEEVQKQQAKIESLTNQVIKTLTYNVLTAVIWFLCSS